MLYLPFLRDRTEDHSAAARTIACQVEKPPDFYEAKRQVQSCLGMEIWVDHRTRHGVELLRREAFKIWSGWEAHRSNYRRRIFGHDARDPWLDFAGATVIRSPRVERGVGGKQAAPKVRRITDAEESA